MRTAVCLTTYNEIATIGGLVDQLKLKADEVVVADGGSTDGTADEARRSGAFVLESRVRAPIAFCMLSAWEAAKWMNADRVVQMDAGGSHNAEEVPDFFGALEDADMVIGSRFLPESRFEGSRSRRWRSGAVTCTANFLARARFTDWTSGFRGFQMRLLRRLKNRPYRGRMHTWQVEVLVNALLFEARIVEIPITYHAGRSSAWRALPDLPALLWRLAGC